MPNVRFAAQSPTAVSVDELIEEAEIAKNTFFASKEDLLSEIVRPVFERGIEELKSVKTQRAGDTARGILAVARTFLHCLMLKGPLSTPK